MKGFLVLIVILVLIVFFVIGLYNALIRLKNRIKEAFAGIDVQLKKRYDLIPNLVAAVKQYTEHEKNTLEKLTELRSMAISSEVSMDEKMEINNEISGVMKGLMVSVENYPDLKASDNFLQLQRSLNEVEEQLSAARRFFNSAVRQYNDAIMVFPSNMIAGMFNMRSEKMFEVTSDEKKNVDVKDLFQ